MLMIIYYYIIVIAMMICIVNGKSMLKLYHIKNVIIVPFIILNPLSYIDNNIISNNIAIAIESNTIDPNDINRLKKGYLQLNYLMNNWDEKTNYCVFGEIKKELLSDDNKNELIDKAKYGSTLDKNPATVNIKCKRDPQVVREFLGLGNEAIGLPLKSADKLMKKPSTLMLVDPDDIDRYIDAVEKYSENIAAADGLSYSARTDYSSTENASKGDTSLKASDTKEDYLANNKSVLN
jgi:hypothetical protein